MSLTIEITAEDIAGGTRGRAIETILEPAVRRVAEPYAMCMGTVGGTIWGSPHLRTAFYQWPREVIRWLRDYNTGGDPGPFTFKLG
jgi:hypothetical protein